MRAAFEGLCIYDGVDNLTHKLEVVCDSDEQFEILENPGFEDSDAIPALFLHGSSDPIAFERHDDGGQGIEIAKRITFLDNG